MDYIAIIADDLTGANDTGVQFTQHGFETIVVIDSQNMHVEKDKSVWAINTDTRRMNSVQAYEKVFQITLSLRQDGISRIYKKIDSTLRGHPGAELEALMDAWKTDFAIVVPAFPANQRYVKDGHLFLGTATPETQAEKFDGKASYCYVPEVLCREIKRTVGQINIQAVRKGPESLFRSIEKARETSQVVVIDALKDDDLEMIALAIRKIPENVVIAGSAGLASRLPLAWNMKCAKIIPKPIDGLCLFIAGSRNPVTQTQVESLSLHTGINPIVIDVEKIIRGDISRESMRVVRKVRENHHNHKAMIITVDTAFDAPAEIANAGQIIAGSLGNLVAQLLETVPVKGLVLTGGDTAYHICRSLQGLGINLKSELLEGIPYGKIVGGIADGLPVVTKAGGFGDPDAFVKVYQYLIS